MPWPLPAPAEISDQLAGTLEQALGPLAPDGQVDARSPNTLLGVLARTLGLAQWQLHLHLRTIADDLMPDTAGEEILPRHAAVWGVSRIPAAAAAGSATVAGTNGTVIPSGTALLGPADATYATTASATISGGTATLAVAADVAGTAGNADAGAILRLVSPIAGLSPQTATVAAGGLAGGLAEETLEAWRSRVLARIRARSKGGTATDYEQWARRAPNIGQVAVRQEWVGPGTVGLIFAMAGGTAPSAPDIARVEAEIAVDRPVTAQVFVVGATIVTRALTLQIQPDTTAVRAAITAAFAAFLAREPGIGGTISLSRLSEALSSAADEYAHRIVSPSADVVLTSAQLAVPGAITWQAWS
jgi:uncharacterized phage protein gp47/JayE